MTTKTYFFLLVIITLFGGLIFSASGHGVDLQEQYDTVKETPKYILPDKALRPSVCLDGLWDFKSHVDTTWTHILVPGSYTGVRKMWGGEVWDCWDYPERWEEKGAEYKRSFTVPTYMQGKNITFYCGGSAHHTKVYVNGHFAGESYDAWIPFEFDITKFLKKGPDELIVEITDEPSKLFSDLRTHLRGIWRDTRLNAYGDLSVTRDAFITTSVQKKRITVSIPVVNHTSSGKHFFVRYFVTDTDGKVVFSFDGGWHRIAGRDTLTIQTQSSWQHPHLWFPYDPYLYHLHTILYNEKMQPADHNKIRFGFREITWQGPHLYMNGQEMFLHGHGGHAEGDLMESRAFYRTWFGNLKKRGVDYMRLHNGPKDAVLYEVADELGFLLEAEPAFHFEVPKDTAFALKHLGGMVKLLRNHPSVIVWSVSNELRWRGGGEKKYLIDYVHSLDTTRPVFASDFTLQSRFGDVVGHHYNPKTVFEEWKEYGPDKPMIWDEMGSVWQHDRPMGNGTAGYEVSAQDYATGLWYDGYEQILQDIEGSIDGKMINSEPHRPNIFIPWDLSYNFFRFQPVNKDRPMKLHWDNYDTCGIKISKIKPAATTVNIWDPTLPVMEPNPGFYIFSKHLMQVRFLGEDRKVAWFGGIKLTRTGKLYYEDLRPADTVDCRVESPEGLIYWEKKVPFAIRPGEIRDQVSFTFQLPEVDKVTPVKLVREFRYRNKPGYRHEENMTVFPALDVSGIDLHGLKIGVIDPNKPLQLLLEHVGIPFRNLKNRKEIHYKDIDMLLTTGISRPDNNIISFMKKGGRWVSFATIRPKGNDKTLKQVSRVTENFDGKTGEVTDNKPFVSSSSGLVWKVRLAGKDMVNIAKNILVDQYSKLIMHTGSGKNIPFFTVFDGKYLAHPDRGRIVLRYEYAGWNKKLPAKAYVKSVRVLLQDAKGQWYVSDNAHKIMPWKRRGMVTLDLSDMQWRPFRFDDHTVNQNKQPDFSCVTGAGILVNPEQSVGHDLILSKMVFQGEALPSARIPLNGSRHLLLQDMDQRYFTWWRGGSAGMILNPPYGKISCRNILLGNKDGVGSALYEVFAGKGLGVVTALNIPGQTEKEPAAARMFKNIIEYAAGYRPAGTMAGTMLWSGKEIKDLVDTTGLVYTQDGDLTNVRNLIIDGRDASVLKKVSARLDRIKVFVRNGGHVWIQQVDKKSLPVFRQLVAGDLQLTDPFRGQRSHCVKAAVSWTLRHTPKTPVEYYDSILIPQPFEPNLDPLLTGLANRDLTWGGRKMFDKGVELKGMDPVDPAGKVHILISNWGIDWSQPDLFGEYTHEAQDWQRATWFINRDPVLLKVDAGSGYYLINQLDFFAGGEKGTRLLAQLLTGMGCAIGIPAYLPGVKQSFDLAPNLDQLRRFAKTNPLLPPAQRIYYGPSPELTGTVFPSRSRENVMPTVLMLGDSLLNPYMPAIRKELQTHYELFKSDPVQTTSDLLYHLENRTGTQRWNTIVISVGMGDVRKENGRNRVSPEKFQQNLKLIVAHLKKTGAKLYWITLFPVSGIAYDDHDLVVYNESARRIMDSNGVYTIDLYDFVKKSFPEWQNVWTQGVWDEIGKQVADGIKHFGAQF